MVKIELELTDEEYIDLLKTIDIAGYIYSSLADFVDDSYKPKLENANKWLETFLSFTDEELVKKFFRKEINMDDERKHKDLFQKLDVLDDIREYEKFVVYDETWIDLDEDDYDEEAEDEKELLIKKLLNK